MLSPFSVTVPSSVVPPSLLAYACPACCPPIPECLLEKLPPITLPPRLDRRPEMLARWAVGAGVAPCTRRVVETLRSGRRSFGVRVGYSEVLELRVVREL